MMGALRRIRIAQLFSGIYWTMSLLSQMGLEGCISWLGKASHRLFVGFYHNESVSVI